MRKLVCLVLAVLMLTATAISLTACQKDPLQHLYGRYEDSNQCANMV